jgi:hypothetical protein
MVVPPAGAAPESAAAGSVAHVQDASPLACGSHPLDPDRQHHQQHHRRHDHHQLESQQQLVARQDAKCHVNGHQPSTGCETRVLAVDPAILSTAAPAALDADAYTLPVAAATDSCDSNGGAALAAALSALQQAGELLRRGQLVALPTETVYGLAASALDATAVARIFAAKGRPADNPLIVHVSDMAMLRGLYPGGGVEGLV